MAFHDCKISIRSVCDDPCVRAQSQISRHRIADKDLLNTLYDADHFRIALGQLSTAKHLIETVCRDYVRLLKYAQSLFQAKQLKRAALGRMATITRRLKDPLLYLEQVRQHLARLPAIDPNTRTLLVCGYPNVGKSSFLRAVTRADVDVQPYAFTTKSLFVGHFDYRYLRFQAIDTPGLLDHPLEEMNTIEMQSITAIAHLRAAVLYFMDLSEHCGYSVAAQIHLFTSIRPLFANKLVFVVVNKIDLVRPDDLDLDDRARLDAILAPGRVELLQLSCTTSEGVMAVRNAACDRLVADRIAQKLKPGRGGPTDDPPPLTTGPVTGRLDGLLARIHVARPSPAAKPPEVFIPEAVTRRRAAPATAATDDATSPRRLERDLEIDGGGPGVYSIDLKKRYHLEDDGWRYDHVPEVLNGQNVYDFVDPDIEARLAALEEEEDRLEAEGFYDLDHDDDDASSSLEGPDDAHLRLKADLILTKRRQIRREARTKRSSKNRPIMPRPAGHRTVADMGRHLDGLGLDPSALAARARSRSRGRRANRTDDVAPPPTTADHMDLDQPAPASSRAELLQRARGRARSQSNRRETGLTNLTARSKAERLAKLGQHKMNRMARQGEADRHIPTTRPKHLVRFVFLSR